MGFIYRIKNKINNKSYIGQTTKDDPNIRWIGHKRAIKSGAGCPLLREAFQKYGVENFEFGILIVCFDKDLNRYEKEYIKKYNTFGENGYNASAGGEPGGTFRGHTHTKENRELFSRISTDYNSRPEEREYRRNLMIKRFSDPEERRKNGELIRIAKAQKKADGTGYIRTKEHTEKIRQALIKRYNNRTTSHNIDKRVAIDWTEDRRLKHSEVLSKANGKPVAQYSTGGVLIETFPTITAAYKKTGIKISTISAHLTRQFKTSGGYIWKYVNKELKGALDISNQVETPTVS